MRYQDDIYDACEVHQREMRLAASLAEQERLRQAGDPERLRLDAIFAARKNTVSGGENHSAVLPETASKIAAE